MLALSQGSTCIFTFPFSEATSQLSFQRYFMNDKNYFAFQGSGLSPGHQFQRGSRRVSSMPVFQLFALRHVSVYRSKHLLPGCLPSVS